MAENILAAVPGKRQGTTHDHLRVFPAAGAPAPARSRLPVRRRTADAGDHLGPGVRARTAGGRSVAGTHAAHRVEELMGKYNGTRDELGLTIVPGGAERHRGAGSGELRLRDGERADRARRPERLRAHDDIREFYLGHAKGERRRSARSSSTAAGGGMADALTVEQITLKFGGLTIIRPGSPGGQRGRTVRPDRSQRRKRAS